MASRVNTKFVIALSAVVVLLFAGLLGVFLYIKFRSGAEVARAADKKVQMAEAALAAGDAAGSNANFSAAERIYGKAVFKDPNDLTILDRWLATLERWAPATRTELENAYTQSYRPCLRQLALVKQTDVASHRRYLDEIWDAIQLSAFSREEHDFLASEASRTIELAKGSTDPAWKTLYRYRGLANGHTMSARLEIKPEIVQQTKTDLETALAADPTDADVAVALYEWYMSQANGANRENRMEEAEAIATQGRDVLRAFVAANPADPIAEMAILFEDIDEAQRLAGKGGRGDDAIAAFRARIAEISPRMDAVATNIGTMPLRRVVVPVLAQFQNLEKLVMPENRSARTESLIRAMLEKYPADVGLNHMLAVVLADQNRHEEAIVQLQKLRDLPQKPVGLEGVQLLARKTEAVYLQSTSALELADTVKTPEERTATLERVRTYRKELAALVPEDAPQLAYIDAMLRVADRDWQGAYKLLARYNRATGERNPDALWVTSQVARQINRPGEARDLINKLMAIQGPSSQVITALAQIEHQLGNEDQAKALLAGVVKIDPNNSAAQGLLNEIQLSKGEIKNADPVVQELIDAERVANGTQDAAPDVATAIGMLEQAAERHNNDPRIMQAIAIGKSRIGDRAGAIAALDIAIAAKPDEEGLKRFRDRLANDDPLGAQLADIDTSTLPEADKQLQKYFAYRSAGKNTEANEALDKAFALAPEDRRVAEERFIRAIAENKLDEAAKLAELAAAKDLDNSEGLWYRARLLVAQQNLAEGLVVLEQLGARGTASVEQYRLRARVETLLGRPSDAARSYGEALRLRPNDLQTHIALIQLLASQNKFDEGLARAREAERYGRMSPTFMEVLLNLEAVAGDRTQAQVRREQIAKSDPGNTPNKLALTSLYLDFKKWEMARALIDEMRAKDDTLELAVLEARYFADQDDFAAAELAFNQFIGRQEPAKRTMDLYIAAGSFFADRGMIDSSIVAFNAGQPLQNPKIMEVDRARGDAMSRIGRLDLAAESYQRIVDGGADGPEMEVRQRLTEVCTEMGDFEKATAVLASIPDSPSSSASMLMLRASIAAGMKDDVKAAELLNRAISSYPSVAAVYVRRAQFNIDRGGRGEDVLSDLNAALKVDPTFWPAFRTRARFNALQNRMQEAVDDLRAAVRANPRLDDVRETVIARLVELGRAGEAVELADEAVKLRPGDVEMIRGLGAVFARAEDWTRANRYFKLAWNLGNREDVAKMYLNSLFAGASTSPANDAEGEAILRLVQDKIEGNTEFLLARGTLLARRGRNAEAARDLVASLNAADASSPALMVDWLRIARRAVPRPGDFLLTLESDQIKPELKEWIEFFKSTVYADDPGAKSRAINSLEELVAGGKVQAVVQIAHRMLGTLYYNERNFERAVNIWQAGTAKFPNDWELANNLAFVLAKELGRPDEALPYAERSVAAAPDTPEALDTLGFTYMANNRFDDANKQFERASLLARTATSRVPILLHTAELKIKQGRKDEAKALISTAEQIIANNEKLSPQYTREVEALKGQL